LKITYPWADVPVGGGFFVPTLKAEEVRREGLVAAIHAGVPAKAETGIYNNQYGVMFRRVGRHS